MAKPWAIDPNELDLAKTWFATKALRHLPELEYDMAILVSLGADYDRLVWHAWRRWWANAGERN